MRKVERGLPQTPQIRIVEMYDQYEPPLNVALLIRLLLDTVPARYLQGLDCVVLTNEASLSKRERLPRVRSRKKRQGKVVLGRYHPGARTSTSYIELRVDKIVAGLRGWAGKLNANFIRRRYRYAMFVIRPGFKLYGFMRRKRWI